MPNVASVDELRQMLNPTNVPDFEAVARAAEASLDNAATLEALARSAKEAQVVELRP